MSFQAQIAAGFAPISATYDSGSTTVALTWAQSYIEAYCQRTFDPESVTEFVDPDYSRHQALLDHAPVVEISSIMAYLPSITGGMGWVPITNYMLVNETGLIYDTSNLPGVQISPSGPTWPWLPASLQVSYTYGFDTVPQGLVDVACRLAQQYLENPAQLMQRRVGDTEARFAGHDGVSLGPLDQMILDRYCDVGLA